MAHYRSELVNLLVTRGYHHQCTDLEGLDKAAAAGPVTGYIGFDCTADSLHAGSLVQIMLLRRLQQTGHRPIALMGGGTTKIGDPSGKDEARKILTFDDIAHNMAGIRRSFDRFLSFGENGAIMADNAEWLDGLAYIPFLRDIGAHFSINRMLGFDSVKLRLEREQPLSFLEFNYMILQAYDFVELSRRYGCTLQLGGSDQWGNIVSGVDLGRRVLQREFYGFTSPLLTTSSGAKMGKTASGAVWLNADRLPAYDYWQYWRNTEDADVGRFLKLFTDLDLGEIARLERLQGAEINEAKRILANATTEMVHGPEAAREAEATARRVFEEGAAGSALPRLSVPRAELERGLPVYEALARTGLAASNSAGRRLVKEGGARLNDVAVASESRLVTLEDLAEGAVKLSAGRKRHALIVPE
jgi:tyrosyl-tRNA synthetase